MWVRALLIGLAACGAACRTDRHAPAPAAGGGDRADLLRHLLALPELGACSTDAGPAVHVTATELAGDAASITFACARVPLSGKVTFFRVAGTWMVSTKQLDTDAAAP